MKRLIPAGILLILIILAYFSSQSYIMDTCNDARELVEICEKDYRDGKDAYQAAEKIEHLWEDNEKPLSFFVNHDRIDDIELELSSLLLYSRSDEEELFYEHIERLKMLLHQLKEDTKINAHSVF